MVSWAELERRFRDVHSVLAFSRLDAQWGAGGTHWRVAGETDRHAKERFVTLARAAGQKLIDTDILIHEVVDQEPNPEERWYLGLKHLSGFFIEGGYGHQLDSDGKQIGIIYIGRVERPAEASAILCQSLSAFRSDLSSEETMPDQRKVFVVHGRNERLRREMFSFLRAIGLEPMEWSLVLKLTGKGAPYIGEILDAAFDHAQAIVVMLTPDDEVRLLPELCSAHDPPDEREFRLQARPNVLFEAGMAVARSPDRTLFVQIGAVKPFSDIAGRHLIRLTNAPDRRQEFAERLRTAGCEVSTGGTDWYAIGEF